MKYVKWIWQNTRGIRLNSLIRVVIGVGQVALGLLMVWLSRHFIDETISSGTAQEVTRMIICLVLTILGNVLLSQLYYILTTKATVVQTNRLRLWLFSSLFSRQLFDDNEIHSGDVTSRLTKDIESVSEVTTATLPQMAVTALQLCGAFLLMRWFDARLAWALLLLTPLAVIVGKVLARRLRQMTLDIRQDESRIQMHVQEGMEHNAVLRSLDSERWVTDRLDDMQQNLRGSVMKRTRFTAFTRLVFGCTFGLGYLLAFVWGGLGLRDGTITFGIMTSFLQLVGMIQHPILQLLNLIPGVIHSTASIDRLEELASAERPQQQAAAIPVDARYGININDVSFRYANGDREIISHLTHSFKAGTKTALMGPTGIGKTTLFRLLLGFIRPTGGTITLTGNEGERCVDESTRGCFVFVPQGNTLMSGSIRYNLQLAKPLATDEQLREVLHTACADFVFDLPLGLDTQLGERGSGLSEGQSQRIAIARGLLRPGSILLLDEISSSLDKETEQELYRRLFSKFPDKTMIFITHRMEVSSFCDDILKF